MGERAAIEPRSLYRALVHPHPVSRFLSVVVVAIDLQRMSVHWVAGKDDPKAPPEVPPEDRSGLVPDADRSAVVAIFNGGFQSRHGHWGMMLHGNVFVPPRSEGCTVALGADGAVQIRSWPAIAGGDPRRLSAYRQTPPCLVENGTAHPNLLAGNDRAWAGNEKDLKTRRRSALGVDRSGSILFYGLGEEVDARYLAEGMKAAGAAYVAELDINWNWTRFLLVGKGKDGDLEFTSTLVPNMPHGRHEYLSRPTARDFFYVRRVEGA